MTATTRSAARASPGSFEEGGLLRQDTPETVQPFSTTIEGILTANTLGLDTMDDAPAFMNLTAFARLHGVSKPTVTGWRRRGHLQLTADGRVDVAASNARLAARPAARHGGLAKVKPIVEEPAAADPANWSRGEALRQREIAQARLAQIEADRVAGLVVLKAEVAGVVRAEYTIVRTAMLGLASKLAHRLAACASPEGCGALVHTEVRSILEALTADGKTK
jgi:hypothetical protein